MDGSISTDYRWHYTINGDCNLPPLLLLHGWMGSSDDYQQIIRLLPQFYCIAIDLPGHGKTEVINDDRSYDFIATARGIIELLNSLEIDRTAISGYSFGSRIALYLALEFPDRFDRVILESTSPGLATERDRQARIASDANIIRQLETANFSNFVTDWYHQQIFTGIEGHRDFSALIDRRMSNNPSNLAKSLHLAGLGQQPYLGDRLKVHTRPILLLVGALDLKFIAIAQNLHQEYPSITLKIIPDCSHNVHFQQPELWVNAWEIGLHPANLLVMSCQYSRQ
jgi:2-succinyl-6-hydroxy-2,4-cyclohexadiene-1-carboxylate synthase